MEGEAGVKCLFKALDHRNPGLESGRASLKRAYEHAISEKHRMTAETFFRQGLRREALAEITQAVMAEPKNSRYQFLLGECLEAAGDLQGANKAFLYCVILDPTNSEAAGRAKDVQKAMGMSSADVAKTSGQVANEIVKQYDPAQQQAQQQKLRQMQQQMQMQQMQQQQQQFAAQAPGSFRVAQPEQQAMQQQVMQQQAMQQQAMQQQAMQQPVQQMQPSPQQQMQHKGMFEGGSQQHSFNSNAMNFRTHDESQQAQAAMEQEMRQQQARQQQMAAQQQAMQQQQAQQQQVQQQVAAQPTASANDALAQVSVLESQRDYGGAANLLKQMTETQVENAELHHRLAINLLNLGQVAEAIPEFRIASALKPAMKAYSDDLARAMQIHKQSLVSDKSDSTGSK